jgi:hypothetical protein
MDVREVITEAIPKPYPFVTLALQRSALHARNLLLQASGRGIEGACAI